MGDAPIRYTKSKASYELSWTRWILIKLFVLGLFLSRQTRPVWYHPIALIGIALAIVAYVLHPWALVGLLCAVLTALVVWARVHHDSYRKYAQWRLQSFLAGFRYRWRPRKKLRGSSTLRELDSAPLISTVRRQGCVDTVRIKMSYGHTVDWWREDSPRIAQSFNALDCKINPYRRKELNPFSKTLVTKPRWVELEFLTKDPFNSHIGIEYINHYTDNTLDPVVAPHRTGATYRHNLRAHRLRVAMTRWGKSNAIRAMVYAQRHNLKNGLLELWGIDGKGGVEQSQMQHLFARVAFGDSHLNPNAYNPTQFDRLLKDAVKVLKRRQLGMRGKTLEHTPTPDEPWLLLIIDELLVLTNKVLDPNLRTSIANNIMLIQQQGIACGVSLDCSTQLAQKELISFRDGFTEFEVGKVERNTVDMIFGTGWWERGVRADDISEDLHGVFYVKTDATMAPTQIRYPEVTRQDVRGLPGYGKSKLWPPKQPPKPATNGHRKPVRRIAIPKPAPVGVIDQKPVPAIAGAAEETQPTTTIHDIGGFA
jgi:S-DNA-T family DNA segregation ATPase FtsK/SpoIIIE